MSPSKTFRIGILESKAHTDWFSKIQEALQENAFEIVHEKDQKNFWKKVDAVVCFDCISPDHLEKCREYKVVPILPDTCGLKNFNATEETGNAFTFQKDSFWQCMAALFRASVNFEFSYDWMIIRKNLGK